MVGRKQYYAYYGNDGLITPETYYKDRSKSLDISVKVWKNSTEDGSATGKTAFDYSSVENESGNLGSNAIFLKTKEISQKYKGTSNDKTLESFKKILETFLDSSGRPLIDSFNP